MNEPDFWTISPRYQWRIVLITLIPLVFTTVGTVLAARDYAQLKHENSELRKKCVDSLKP